MVGVGDTAPDFQGTTENGGAITLASLKGRPLVLYFYPKADTAGCTAEARGFAEHYAEFEKAGVRVVGVSVDPVDAQRRFHEKCQLPFPLVADANRTIARAYGVLGAFGVAKRVTFLIGANGAVEEVYQGILPGAHIRRALAHWAPPSASASTEGGA